MSRSNPRMQI